MEMEKEKARNELEEERAKIKPISCDNDVKKAKDIAKEKFCTLEVIRLS